MARQPLLVLLVVACLLLLPGSALAAGHHYHPGSAGAGDPYFPLDGNGGYNVRHYDLEHPLRPRDRQAQRRRDDHGRRDPGPVAVRPRLHRPDGPLGHGRRAVPRSCAATGQELIVTPRHGILPTGASFVVRIRYDGIPTAIEDPALGANGWFHTDDGAVVVGEPHVASTWFPVNDHPSDKASYPFHITVPKGLEAVAQRRSSPARRRAAAGRPGTGTRRSRWLPTSPPPRSASSTSTPTGPGSSIWDAIDPDLLAPVADSAHRYPVRDLAEGRPRRTSGSTRTINVPVGGADLSFWVTGETEFPWDFVFVEAHTAGSATTGRRCPTSTATTARTPGFSCPFWLGLHPFLAHYQTDNGDGTCSPSGTTGAWWAATGAARRLGAMGRRPVGLGRQDGRGLDLLRQ